MLERILARVDAQISASTLLREVSDPGARLCEAVQRYTDALHAAAEQIVGPQRIATLDTNEPAWPTLRANSDHPDWGNTWPSDPT
jgi:hypothetical protein